MNNINEIAQKLDLSVEEVSSSPIIQSTYNEIKNNPNISEEDKDVAYSEMLSIYKSMKGSKNNK